MTWLLVTKIAVLSVVFTLEICMIISFVKDTEKSSYIDLGG